ncbi:MAG: GHKL domain-containing protein [Bacilli bacterium]|nr:GHKL domain-containing protein [Bacilli bacterium]
MNIYLIISLIITTILSFLSIKNFSKSKIKIKNIVIYFFIVFPFLLITNLFFDGIIKLISVLLISTFALYFSLFNNDLTSSLYYAVIYDIFAFIVEILLSIIFVSLTKLNLQNNFTFLMLIFSIVNSISIYLISKINIISNFIIKFNKIILNKQYEYIYFIIIMILMTLMIIFNFNNFDRDLSFYINSGMIVFVFITLIYIVNKDLKNNKLENNYNEMMEYVQKYEKIINDQGKKNHEYNNQLMVIKGYSHDPEKLEEYLELITNEHKCGQNYTIRQLSNFPDGGIKGLIYHKLGKMEDNNIKYYLYIDKESKNIFEEKFDLKTYQDITKLLGVFLDNAIDASKEAETKEIELDIKNEDNCVTITISNTFNNNIDTKQIGKKGFTTKGVGHGYGLSIVKDINKHNDNIETINDIEDDKFTQTILIYYK